jgi:tetratricopeptide (TPR) repeat protein
MNYQNHLQSHSSMSTSKVIIVEAEPGQSRHEYLKQWLNQAQQYGATTWLLSCDRREGGPWAGLSNLFSQLVPILQELAPNLITQHDYELVHVLPALRRTLSVRHLSLTDTAPEDDQVRNHPADRVLRTTQGLVDLLSTWHQQQGNSPLIIACDQFNHASSLVFHFFTALIRRNSHLLDLTLLIALDPGTSELVTNHFDSKHLEKVIKLALPSSQIPLATEQTALQLAEELALRTGEDEIEQEINLPRLIHYWLASNQPQKALIYQIRACQIYRKRGYYDDALFYGEAALAQLKLNNLGDILHFSQLLESICTCYSTLNQSEKVLPLLEYAMRQVKDPDVLCRSYYQMAILYARYFPDRDLIKSEAFLKQGLELLDEADLPQYRKLLRAVSLYRGLALIRLRQGKYQEAIEIGQTWYEKLQTEFEPNQELLHKSILLSIIARVYATIGSYHEAVTYFSSAIKLDPNYSEYYNERGNIYFKMGRLNEALSDYLKASELSPPYPEVWSNLGQCYRLLGQMTEAVDAYSISLDLNPDQSSTLLARAQVFEMLEQSNSALADYNAALALNPKHPLVLANRAILYYDTERYQEALDDLSNAIALSPETSDLYQNRAIALTALGRFEEAVEDLTTYLRLNPDAGDRSEVEDRLLALQSNH